MARYGGDEFVMLMKHIPSKEFALKKGKEICNARKIFLPAVPLALPYAESMRNLRHNYLNARIRRCIVPSHRTRGDAACGMKELIKLNLKAES